MSIEIKHATLGMAQTNTYLVGDTETNEALLIDAVDDAPFLKQMADDAGWTIKLILATHAHWDHVLAARELKELTGAPFAIHEEAVPMLNVLPQQGARFGLPRFPDPPEIDRLLTGDGETVELGAIKFETLYTPGHAPGHLGFLMRDDSGTPALVFSGDALFAGSIGRTDLPGGDYTRLMRSIREKLLTLPDAVVVLSGHGPQTTIGRERATNPFLI
jgi:hydroxyacylglutathione hydrolase